MAAPDKAAREALLEELWTETTRAYLKLLTDPETKITAALLTSVRQWLDSQGIVHGSIGGEKERQRDMSQKIASDIRDLDLDEDDLREAQDHVGTSEGAPTATLRSGDKGMDLPVPDWPARLEDK